MNIVLLIITMGLLLGYIIGYYVKSRISLKRMDEFRSENEKLRKEESDRYLFRLEEQKSIFKETLESERHNAARLLMVEKENASKIMEERNMYYQGLILSMENKFNETIKYLREQVENLTNKILKDRQEEFEHKSEESIGRLMAPLQESLVSLKNALQTSNAGQERFRGEFAAGIESMLKQSELTRRCTEKLSNVLYSGGRAQGEWGETILTELLESQGLIEGIHFDIQRTIRKTK